MSSLPGASAPPPSSLPLFLPKEWYTGLNSAAATFLAHTVSPLIELGALRVARLASQCAATWEGARVDAANSRLLQGAGIEGWCGRVRDAILEGRRLPEVEGRSIAHHMPLPSLALAGGPLAVGPSAVAVRRQEGGDGDGLHGTAQGGYLLVPRALPVTAADVWASNN